jgi:hypothetical protein
MLNLTPHQPLHAHQRSIQLITSPLGNSANTPAVPPQSSAHLAAPTHQVTFALHQTNYLSQTAEITQVICVIAKRHLKM